MDQSPNGSKLLSGKIILSKASYSGFKKKKIKNTRKILEPIRAAFGPKQEIDPVPFLKVSGLGMGLKNNKKTKLPALKAEERSLMSSRGSPNSISQNISVIPKDQVFEKEKNSFLDSISRKITRSPSFLRKKPDWNQTKKERHKRNSSQWTVKTISRNPSQNLEMKMQSSIENPKKPRVLPSLTPKPQKKCKKDFYSLELLQLSRKIKETFEECSVSFLKLKEISHSQMREQYKHQTKKLIGKSKIPSNSHGAQWKSSKYGNSLWNSRQLDWELLGHETNRFFGRKDPRRATAELDSLPENQ